MQLAAQSWGRLLLPVKAGRGVKSPHAAACCGGRRASRSPLNAPSLALGRGAASEAPALQPARCPQPILSVPKHIPACCTLPCCFLLLFFFFFSPPPLHSSSMLSSLGKSIMKGARSGRFSPSSSSSSSSSHCQPGSGFIGTTSTLWAERSPTELVTGEPLLLQPSANPSCPRCPAQLHVPRVGFSHPRRERDSTRSTGDMEHVPCSHGAGVGPCLQQHKGTEVL